MYLWGAFEALSLSVVLASHDNDHKIPRTLDEIFGLNNMLATAMEKIFLKKGIPVVPSLGEYKQSLLVYYSQLTAGNNDIWRM